MRLSGHYPAEHPAGDTPEYVEADGTDPEWERAGYPPPHDFLGNSIDRDPVTDEVVPGQVYRLPADRDLINHVARKVERITVSGDSERFNRWMRGGK